MAWTEAKTVTEVLETFKLTETLRNCPDCDVKPGRPHDPGCDVEKCSVCGGQRLSCEGCKGHDPLFSRWTGIWPGSSEAISLGLIATDGKVYMADLNTFYTRGLHKIFFVKPKK